MLENLTLLYVNDTRTDLPAHPDQRLCYSLSGMYYDFTCNMQTFDILGSLCS